MSALVETQECFPKESRIGLLVIPAPEVAHERCLGGQTTPGVLGGWTCPCPCHRADRKLADDMDRIREMERSADRSIVVGGDSD